MKISHLDECSTTAGAVATVAQPFETVQKRTPATKAKGSNLLKGIKTSKKFVNSISEGEGFPHDVDHMPGQTIKHQNTNCTACHGRKSMYKLGDKLHADNKKGATKVVCPTCKGTGDKEHTDTEDGRNYANAFGTYRYESVEYDADLNDYRVKDDEFKKKHGVSKDEILDKKYFHKPGATPKATSNKQGHDPEHRGTMSGFVREAQGSLTESELKGIRSLGDIVDQRPKGKAVPAQQYKQVDMRDKPCLKCGKGTYGERTFYDDMDGVQRCDKCKHVTKRYIDVPVTEGAKVDRMVGHVKSSEQKLGKSAKEAENIAWATANKRGMLNNKNKKKVKEGSHKILPSARGTGNAGMPTPYDQGLASARRGESYENIYDQPGEEVERKDYENGYLQGKKKGVAEADDKKEWQKQNAKPKQLGKTEKYFSTRHTTKDTGAADKEQGVAEGSGGNWYIRVNGKILNDTKFKPMIFSSEDEARSYAMKLADKKRIPLSQIKLTKSWMDAPEQGVAEGSPQSMGTALANTLSKVEPGSKLDKKIRHHNDMVRRFGPEAGTMTSAPDGYRIDKKGFVRLGQGVAEGKDDKIAQLKKDYNTAVHWSQNERSPQKREAARRKAETIKAHLEKQYKQGVAEGRFVRGPHPVTGQIVDYDRQGNPKEPKVIAPKEPKVRGPRRDSNGLTRDDYQKVWRKIEEVVGNIFPDGDPIDWLAPWLKKSGIEDFHIGEVLDKASKLNGYKDIYAYYDHFKTDDYGYGELAEGEITEDDVVLAPGKGSRLKPGLLHKQEVSVGPIDTVKVDVPLLIRLLEYAREDAKTDMDLHDLAEKLIALGARGRTLTMKDYERLVPETPMDEEQAVLTKPEWLSKRKALQDLQMDPETSKQPMLKQELIKKIADLKRRAEEAGLSEDVDECDFENMYQQKVEEVSDPMVRNYLGKAVYDTLTGKKDRNPGIKRAMNRLSGTNKPLLPKSK